MKNQQYGSALIGQLGLTTCLLLLSSFIYLWMQYHQKIMLARLQQLQCLKQKTDGIKRVVRKINLLNRSIATAQALTTISPAVTKSISAMQALQNLSWQHFILSTFTYKYCPPLIRAHSSKELPFESNMMKLNRNLAGLAMPQTSLQFNIPLHFFGPVPDWWLQKNLQLNGRIHNPFALTISWSMP
jgi:hypothetical protein